MAGAWVREEMKLLLYPQDSRDLRRRVREFAEPREVRGPAFPRPGCSWSRGGGPEPRKACLHVLQQTAFRIVQTVACPGALGEEVRESAPQTHPPGLDTQKWGEAVCCANWWCLCPFRGSQVRVEGAGLQAVACLNVGGHQ